MAEINICTAAVGRLVRNDLRSIGMLAADYETKH